MQTNQQCVIPHDAEQELLKLIPESVSEEMKVLLIKQEKSIRFQSMDEFKDHTEKLKSQDIIQIHQGLVFFRKFMSSGDLSAPSEILVQELINCGIVPILVELIKQNEIQLLVYEAVWIIFNITTGSKNQVDWLLKQDIMGQLSNFLLHDQCPHLILEKVVSIFGNIVAESVKQRDQFVGQGILGRIIKITEEQMGKNTQLFKNCIWVIQVFCRKPNLEYLYVKDVFGLLGEAIRNYDDAEILDTVIQTLFSISESPEKSYAKQIIATGAVPKLINLLNNDKLSEYSLKIIGLVAFGTDEQVDYLFQYDIVSGLIKLLNHKLSKRIVDTLWVISNISGGNKYQVKKIVSNEQLINKLFDLVSTSKEESVVYEAIIVLNNAFNQADMDDTQLLMSRGFLKLLISKLVNKENIKLLIKVLEGIFSVLKKGEELCKSDDDINPCLEELEDLKGLDMIEQLQCHYDQVVYEKAYKILETFYDQDYK